jgi:hypothetical protein
MFPLSNLLTDGLVMSLIFTLVIGGIVWRYPRLMLHDFPADIQALAAPKTATEKRLSGLLFVPVLALFIGLPLLMVLGLKAQNGGTLSFGTAFLYAYGLFFIVNLWDLVVMDWLGMRLVDPQKPPFPGTEGAAGWRDDAFHFRGFLKGCVIGLVMMLPVAALAAFVF